MTVRRTLATLVVGAILSAACTGSASIPGTETGIPTGGPSRPQESGPGPVSPEVVAKSEIYSAVIRRLVLEDHTFGGGPSPFETVYVVNGPIAGVGRPQNDLFGPAPKTFSNELTDGILERLEDLPPVRFVENGNSVRIGRDGMGGARKNGVIISLGPVVPAKDKVHVATALWCGGLCGQWLTYVLDERDDRWRITGTTGTYAIS